MIKEYIKSTQIEDAGSKHFYSAKMYGNVENIIFICERCNSELFSINYDNLLTENTQSGLINLIIICECGIMNEIPGGCIY